MTVRLSSFAVFAVLLAMIYAASSAVLADSAAKPGRPLPDPLGSTKVDGAGVSGVLVDDSATSGSSFAKMFGDLARKSDAPPETSPDAIDNPTVAADTQAKQSQIDSQQPTAAKPDHPALTGKLPRYASKPASAPAQNS